MVKEVTPKAQALIDTFFPGALTIILPKSELVGNVVSGGLDTVAVRMPANEIAHRVIEAAHCPIAAPSANTSGLPSPTRAKYVIDDMAGKIDAIIDGGDCEYGVESTVITLATDVPTILRPGAVTKEMLEDVIGEVVVANAVLHGMKDNETAQSPGMKYKHYAPKARVVIVDANRKIYEAFVNKQKARLLCALMKTRLIYRELITEAKVMIYRRQGNYLTHCESLMKWEQKSFMPAYRIQQVWEWQCIIALFVPRHLP